MRIALTHPYCWPYVRRGTERNLETVGRFLVGQGHDVRLLSTSYPERRASWRGETSRHLLPARCPRPLRSLRIRPHHTFFFGVRSALGRVRPDVVHSFFYSDGLAATWPGRRRSWRTVLQLNGIAIPGVSCHRIPPEGWMLRAAVERADEFVVCSRFIAELYERHYGRRPRVLAPPVDLDQWPIGDGPADGRPTFLAVGDFEVRRKGVRVLSRAFRRVQEELPEARLLLSGRIEPATVTELREIGPPGGAGVEILGLGAQEDLVRLYRSASVLVLPAMWEPSGSVMLEALAAGTPVVATRHGGLPEFLDPEVGVLFDPQTEGEESANVEGLAEAMLEGLRLSGRPGIRRRCREQARRFSSEAIGPRLEEIYAGVD